MMRRGRSPGPPPGHPHRYFFNLYALNPSLALRAGATTQEWSAA